MSEKFDVEYLEVGDTFEGGPIEQSYFISAIMAAGGEVEIHGNIVLIVDLPKKTKAVEVPAPKVEEVKEEPPVAVIEESPVEEAPKVVSKTVSRKKVTPPAPKEESEETQDKE